MVAPPNGVGTQNTATKFLLSATKGTHFVGRSAARRESCATRESSRAYEPSRVYDDVVELVEGGVDQIARLGQAACHFKSNLI